MENCISVFTIFDLQFLVIPFVEFCINMLITMFLQVLDFGHCRWILQNHSFHWQGSQWFIIQSLPVRGYVRYYCFSLPLHWSDWNFWVFLISWEDYDYCLCVPIVDSKPCTDLSCWFLWRTWICLICFLNLEWAQSAC